MRCHTGLGSRAGPVLDSGKWDEVLVKFSSQAFSVISLGPHPLFRVKHWAYSGYLFGWPKSLS